MNPTLENRIPPELSKPRWDTACQPSSKPFKRAMARIHPHWVCYRNKSTGYWEVLFDRGAEIYRGWADSRYKVKLRIEGEDGEPCQPGGAHIPLLNYMDPLKYGQREKERDFTAGLAAKAEETAKKKKQYRKDRAAELNHKVLRALHEDERHDKSGLSAMLAHHVGTRSTYYKGAKFTEQGGLLVPEGAIADGSDSGKSD